MYKEEIIESFNNTDPALRKKALAILTSVCDRSNLRPIVDDVLQIFDKYGYEAAFRDMVIESVVSMPNGELTPTGPCVPLQPLRIR